MIFSCFEAFSGKFIENFSFYSKKLLSQKRAQKYLESLFFLTTLKGTNTEENLDLFNQMLLIKPVKWGEYKQTFFLLKVSHIQLNYAFLLFCSILGKIHREHVFLVQKKLSQKVAEKLSEICFSQQFWKGTNPEENLNLFKQLFLIKPVKWGKYYQRRVFLLKVSYKQLNYAFLLFWSIRGEIYRELLFLVQKVTFSEKSREILRNFFS